MSSRSERRKRIKVAEKLFLKPAGPLVAIDLEKEPHPAWMTRAFRNNRYTVMIDDNCPMNNGKTAIKAMIQAHDDKPIPNHWSEIQKIKNEIFGTQVFAVEYYPVQVELIDQHCVYWIFVSNDIPRPLF